MKPFAYELRIKRYNKPINIIKLLNLNLMKKLIFILIASLVIIGCNKNSSAPSSSPTTSAVTTPTTTVPTTTVYCIFSGTVFVECNTGTLQDAINREQWLRDNTSYTMLYHKAKATCSQCQ